MFGVTLPFQSLTSALRSTELRQIDNAANVMGWMTYEELKWLARQAKSHHLIVEIGSYMGRSTVAIGANTPGKVYAVDDFIGPRDKQLMKLPVFELFCNNNYELINAGKVVPVALKHEDYKPDFNPDMVFIDGDHSYESVKRDVSYWYDKAASGALVCGHDITFPQVKQAVSEVIPNYKVGRKTTIWYAEKP